MSTQARPLVDQLRRLALEADARRRTTEGRPLRDAAVAAANDRYLAHFQVYGFLAARSSLRSRAALVQELAWFKRNPMRLPEGVVDADRFGLFRLALIDELTASLGGSRTR